MIKLKLPKNAILFSGQWYIPSSRSGEFAQCPMPYIYRPLIKTWYGFRKGQKTGRMVPLEELDDRYKHLHKCGKFMSQMQFSPAEDDDPDIEYCLICGKKFGDLEGLERLRSGV